MFFIKISKNYSRLKTGVEISTLGHDLYYYFLEIRRKDGHFSIEQFGVTPNSLD